MCGIAGFWRNTNEKSADWLGSTALNMANTLIHRGPDDSGTWVDEQFGVAFGHRRLSIIDVSHAGHQPMVSSDGRYIVTYNGEVYNFQDLRQQLKKKGHSFMGDSDTEVMLSAFVQWGVESSVNKFNGMFAFAVWDRKDRLLWLVRDRIGEKPLYFGVQNGTLFFASELKAIRAYPHFEPRIDRDALASFLKFNYVPAPYSIYRGIQKLLPGHCISLKSPTDTANSQSYWSLINVVQKGLETPFLGSEEEAAKELETRLKKTIKSRMFSDVPVGAFLSGGIDSSTIVALMQSQNDRPVNTFTIGFSEKEFNEAVHANKVAKHLNTKHTELYISPQEARDVIPKLSEMYDEPFADSSQIPTHLLSVLAREYVTVALSGDGGDELFSGYNRYIFSKKFWNSSRYIPNLIKRKTAKLAAGVSYDNVEGFYEKIEPFLPRNLRISMPGEKYQKMAWALKSSSSAREVYNSIISIIKAPSELLISGEEYSTLHNDKTVWRKFDEMVLAMTFLDLMTYHPDDILQKLDRAAMAVSLETRVPFLDHEMIEFVMRLPMDFKLNNKGTKHILKKVLYKYVPREIMERPKMGFTVPLGDWLKGPLKDWIEELIDSSKLEKEGYFKPKPVMIMWDEHLTGKRNWGHQLWNLAMFQNWMSNNL